MHVHGFNLYTNSQKIYSSEVKNSFLCTLIPLEVKSNYSEERNREEDIPIATRKNTA